MRRAVIIPLTAAVLVLATLVPAGALGLFTDGARPSTVPSPDAVPDTISPISPSPSTAAPAATAAASATTLAPATTAAPAPEAPTPSTPDRDRAPDRVPADREVDRPHLRLACEAVTGGDASGVVCEWSTLDAARGYRLWRAVDPGSGAPRQVVATVPAGEPPRYADREVRPGHRYAYAVEAVAADGSTLAFSEPVRVAIDAPRDHRVRLGCEAAVTDAGRGIACEWSAVDAEAAAGYVLWRSVGDGGREVIARLGIDARPRHLDQDVAAGMAYTYVVQVVDAAGEPLASGGPVTVELRTDDHRVRLGCEAAVTDAGRGIACEWSAVDAEAAAGYVLWRSVGDGGREVIARLGIDARPCHLDQDVAAGMAYTYVVQVVDAAGEPLAISEPAIVRLPDGERDRPVEPAPAPVEPAPVERGDAPR